MTKKDFVYCVLGLIALVYIFCFVLVGACVLGNRDVAECRDNSAGQLVYKTIHIFIK